MEREGWKVLEPRRAARKGRDAEPKLPPGLAAEQRLDVREALSVEKKTRPPRPFTEATLLTGMETAGRQLDDAALSDVMRGAGLGTPATRAATIETLVSRDYIRREKKSLRATDRGMRLIDAVHEQVKSPQMTAEWELRLRRLSEGEGDLEDFMRGIEGYVREVVDAVKSGRRSPPHDAVDRALASGADTRVEVPERGVAAALRRRASRLRGGPVLAVVSSAAEVEKLASAFEDKRGRVAAIHDEHDRQASRATSRAYLEGKVGCLVVDLATLRVAGFPEMLMKRRPAFVALVGVEGELSSELGGALEKLRPSPRLTIAQSS